MKLFPVILLAVMMTGCVTNTITNLTPTQQPRNAEGKYPVEFLWESNQQTLRDWTIAPLVVVGFDKYEMHPTLGITNRWEALVPVPDSQSSINYHFQVNYEFNRMGAEPGQASKMSRIYTLEILDE